MIGGDAGGDGPFVWTAESGPLALDVFLTAHGLDVTGWSLRSVQGISDDGRTIVGFGTNPDGDTEGFIAIIPEPGTGLLVAIGLAGFARRRRAVGDD